MFINLQLCWVQLFDAEIHLVSTSRAGGLIDGVFQCLASFEAGDARCWYFDGFASLWIAPHACRAILDGKGAKSRQNHGFAVFEAVHYRIKE